MIGSIVAFILIPMCSNLILASTPFTPEIPDECKHAKVCDFIPNYPTKEMEKIIKELSEKGIHPNKIDAEIDLVDIAHNASHKGPAYLPAPSPPLIPSSVEVGLHDKLPGEGMEGTAEEFDYEDEEVELCRTVISIKYPKAARDKNDKWFFVINNERDPYQAFRVELCAPDAVDKPCGNDNLQVTFQSGYESRCVQKYIWRYVLAVNQTGQVFKMNAQMPGCCSCIAKTVFN